MGSESWLGCRWIVTLECFSVLLAGRASDCPYKCLTVGFARFLEQAPIFDLLAVSAK